MLQEYHFSVRSLSSASSAGFLYFTGCYQRNLLNDKVGGMCCYSGYSLISPPFNFKTSLFSHFSLDILAIFFIFPCHFILV